MRPGTAEPPETAAEVAASEGRGIAPGALLRGAALGFCAVLIWGIYFALSRAGTTTGLTPPDFALLRFAPAALAAFPVLAARGLPDLGGVGWGRALVLTLLAGPPFILIATAGFLYAPLAHGAVMQPGTMALGTFVIAMLLGARPDALRLAGVGAILLGLVLVAGDGLLRSRSGAWKGDLLFMAAGLCWAVFSVLLRRWRMDGVAASAAVAVLGGAITAPAFVLLSDFGRLAALTWGALVAQILVQGVLSGFVAVLAYAHSVTLLGATRAALFPTFVPAVAVLAGIPITGELPEPIQVAGMLVMMLGLSAATGAVGTVLRRR